MMVRQGEILRFTIVTDREWVTEAPKTGSPIQSTSQTSGYMVPDRYLLTGYNAYRNILITSIYICMERREERM